MKDREEGKKALKEKSATATTGSFCSRQGGFDGLSLAEEEEEEEGGGAPVHSQCWVQAGHRVQVRV